MRAMGNSAMVTVIRINKPMWSKTDVYSLSHGCYCSTFSQSPVYINFLIKGLDQQLT